MAVHTFTSDGITVQVTLPQFAEDVLADQVESNAKWLEGFANMVAGKVASVKRRIAETEAREALAEGRADRLKATEDALVQAVFDRPGYKTRAERELAEE